MSGFDLHRWIRLDARTESSQHSTCHVENYGSCTGSPLVHGAQRPIDFFVNAFTNCMDRAIAHQELCDTVMRCGNVAVIAIRRIGRVSRLKEHHVAVVV